MVDIYKMLYDNKAMIQDVDCRSCQHYTYCKRPCPCADIIADGNTPQREPHISSIIIERLDNQDYNAILSDMIEDRRNRDANAIEDIRTIPDMRIRLIAAAILVHIPQRNIAKLINHSQGRISQLYQTISIKRINNP
jgi:hypothetical protein